MCNEEESWDEDSMLFQQNEHFIYNAITPKKAQNILLSSFAHRFYFDKKL